MPKFRFTKARVQALAFTDGRQKLYWDEELRGFGLLVGKASKTYVAQRDVNGRSVRVTIGRSDLYSSEKARDVARKLLVEMREGRNPNKERREKQAQKRDLRNLFDDYISTKKANLASGTIVGYQDIIENHFKDWWKRELPDIGSQDVISRYAAITEQAGKGAAGHSMRLLRALFNYAAIDDENLRNPVNVLTKKKLWHPSIRRQNILKTTDLKNWFECVQKLQNDSFRDALIVILFTGLRKNEAFTLKWEHVYLDHKSMLIPKTKNREPLKLPLNSVVYDVLSKRKEAPRSDVWVFDSSSKAGHITDAASSIRKIKSETGLSDFSLHALRRTFMTTAERLDISPYSIKALVNHKLGNDVTAGYIVRDVERLRAPSQSIADELNSHLMREH